MARFCGRTLPPGLKRQMVTTIRGIERGMGNGDSFCVRATVFGRAARLKKETISSPDPPFRQPENIHLSSLCREANFGGLRKEIMV